MIPFPFAFQVENPVVSSRSSYPQDPATEDTVKEALVEDTGALDMEEEEDLEVL